MALMEIKKAEWLPRSVACVLIGEGLGLEMPISSYRLMQFVRAGKLKVRTLGGPLKPRYFISRVSIEKFIEG